MVLMGLLDMMDHLDLDFVLKKIVKRIFMSLQVSLSDYLTGKGFKQNVFAPKLEKMTIVGIEGNK